MIKNNRSGVYGIFNKFTGKLYIGSAIKFHRRYTDHIYFLKINKHHSILLQRAYDKYEIDAFEFIVLEYVEDKNLLLDREQYWIDLTQCFDPTLGYNISRTAGSLLGLKQSDSAKLKKSKALKGIVRSEETKNKMSEAKKGHLVSEETRKKIGEASRGRMTSDETKAKIAITSTGRLHSEETRAIMRENAKGRKPSNLALEKALIANTGRIHTAEERAKRSEGLRRSHAKRKALKLAEQFNERD